ncbi:MAG: family 43 glycosylhydrolase [Clostridia bacterium]|nr:family 43 glycosylhydrolase [Clostridia bacterium]
MKRVTACLLAVLLLLGITVSANNPIVKEDNAGNRVYAGDPAAIVVGDTVYLFCGHDTSTTNYYYMPEWLCYSSKDMVNWEYEGVPMRASDFSWGSASDAWAGEVEYYNGKYYFFMCKNATGISVGVSDTITGPYKDHLNGRKLVEPGWTRGKVGWDDIDPTVWVELDSEGVEHRYIMWGNSNLYISELNEEMNSLMDLNGDGAVNGGDITELFIEDMPLGTTFTEAPWIYKRGDLYYLFFANNWHEELSYATSESVTGPYTYGGKLMEAGASSNTNHPSVIDFKGKTYIFYHTGAMENGSGYRRSVCVDELIFNEDGSIDLFYESSVGLDGTKVYISPVSDPSCKLYHGYFSNTTDETAYPAGSLVYCDEFTVNKADFEWEIIPGRGNEDYVSIQAVNKMGYFITNYNSYVKLLHDNDAQSSTAQSMTFIKRDGLCGEGVSFESMTQRGMYLTVSDGVLTLTNGYNKKASSFIVTEVNNPDALTVNADENGIHLTGTYTGENTTVLLYIKNADGKVVDLKFVRTNDTRKLDYTYKPEASGTYTVVFGAFKKNVEF